MDKLRSTSARGALLLFCKLALGAEPRIVLNPTQLQRLSKFVDGPDGVGDARKEPFETAKYRRRPKHCR